jgi:putative nucleotidyltransferase with HDIG domain
MDPFKVWLIDSDIKRKEHLSRLLVEFDLQAGSIGSVDQLMNLPPAEEKNALALIALNALGLESADILGNIRTASPRISLVLLTDAETADQGSFLLKKGLADQVAGADNWGSIYSAVKGEIARKELARKIRAYARQLRKLRLEQSANELRAAELEESYTATLENLMTALDLRDVETFGHSLTVAKYCRVLAQLLGIKEPATLDNIRKGALLHDIGKIAIPDAILKKPSRLSAAEWEKIKLHPVLGYGLIKEIKLVKEIGNIILYHHERYDGSGYPRGLKREAIPLEARIFALADALDAITSHRPYRKERDFRAARKDIRENRGRQFDPKIVDAFSSVKTEDWERIRYETTKVLPGLEKFSALYNHE